MFIFKPIIDTNDMIDNYLANQEYARENELYDRMTIGMLMEYWAIFESFTEEKKKTVSYIDVNRKYCKFERT